MRKISILILFLSCYQLAISQTGIEGPTCVIPGVEYQYLLPRYKDSSAMQICITGGLITESLQACESEYSKPFIRIKWDSTSTSGFISLTISDETISDTVMITEPLNAGTIDSSNAEQFIAPDSLPRTINCSPATGGGCAPAYIYQWQQSENSIDWDDIAGATDQDLSFTSIPQHSTFYRRRVTDTISSSVLYSSVAVVYITSR